MALNRAQALQIIDPVLSNLARRYTARGFIYDQIVKKYPVQTLSGQYPVFDKNAWFQNEVDNLVRDRAPSKEIDFSWGTELYLCKEFALKVSITDLERQQANPALRLEQSKSEFLSLRMAIAREVRLANLLRDTAHGGGLTSGNETTPSTAWDNSASNPEADLRAASLSMYNATGLRPNTLVIPYPVAYNLATMHGTDTFRGQMIYTVNGAQAISQGVGLLPDQIHGMRVIIPEGPQTTSANEGAAATGTVTEIWGKHVRLLYVDDAGTWGNPSVAYAFQHTAPLVSRWRQNDPDIDYIRQWERVDEKVVAPDCGWVLTNVIS